MENLIDSEAIEKLNALDNPKVVDIVKYYVNLCKPAKVTVLTDDPADEQMIRQKAIDAGEERKLGTDGHTVHFDNYGDQARDREHTWVLLPKGKQLSKHIKTIDYDEGMAEATGILSGIMEGREMFVGFYSLGPAGSKFSISAFQMTDSATVIHQQNILYRKGYEQFKALAGSDDFFHVIHSQGEINPDMTSKNIDKRRVYIDLDQRCVLTMNNQYGGSSIGLKKLSLRLSIDKANKEDWLCEHMFITGIKPEGKDRVTYFTGAFPSWCGKTSTAMIDGQTIVGDDIAFLRRDESGACRTANVEQGIFGVIKDVCPKDDPIMYKAITTPREVVFNNVLVSEGRPYWLGMGEAIPKKGFNHSGEWWEGKTDNKGKPIDPSHKNARFTLRISDLDNADPEADNPEGVPVGGIIYGGRDSDTTVPVLQSLSWAHGVFIGATIESQSTVAAMGAAKRELNPMANMDFLVVPLSNYISNHLKFGASLSERPSIFSTNYFMTDSEGNFLTEKTDKKVWLLWMEGRVHGEYEAIETPVGMLPKHEDLQQLFQQVFQKDFSKDLYNTLFSIRVDKLLAKLDRMQENFMEESMPDEFQAELDAQRNRLEAAKSRFGKNIIAPEEFLE